MKFDQLIEHNVRNIFFKNHAENQIKRLALDFFLLFKNAFYEV